MPALSAGSLDAEHFRQRYAAIRLIQSGSPWPFLRSVGSTVMALVLFATYLGIGALAHDSHFSLAWALASTALVWAGPAQIILISTLGSGATVLQAAIAVTVSAIRLFPMVVSVLPMLRTPRTKRRRLIFMTHFIAITMWVECFRLLPQVPRDRRIAFTN